MKKRVLTLLVVVFAAALLTGIVTVGTSAKDNDYVKSVKTLIGENGGSLNPGGSEWAPCGNYSAYNQEVEQIEDASQDDGGDIIFHTATNVDNTELTAGSWGFSKHSETRSKACYDINGLVIKYYDNTSTQKFILFNENYGQLNSGRFFGIRFNMSNATQGTNNGNIQLGVWYQDNPSGSYTWDNLTWLNWSDYNYGNDYDYFSDPDAKYYNGGLFKGTQNTLEFILDTNGDLCMYLNGSNMANLTSMGIVSKVISHCTEGMYVAFWGEGSTGTNALKLTDMYNMVKEWTTGVPTGYTAENEANVEYKMSSTGAPQFRKAVDASSYSISYDAPQYLANLTLKLSLDGEAMAENDVFTITLGTAELAFRKTSATTAGLTITANGTSTEEEEVPFLFSNVSNKISLKMLKNFTLDVNGTIYGDNLAALAEYESSLENGQTKVGFRMNSSASSVLTIDEYASESVQTYESVDGLTVTGDNLVIKSDGQYYAIYNTQNGSFSVKPSKKGIANSLNLAYKYGAANDDASKFSIGVGKLKFEFSREAEKTNLSILVNGEKVAENQITYDWNYTLKQFCFANDNGYGYLLTNGVTEYLYVDKAEDKSGFDKIEAALNEIPDGMIEVVLSSENGQGLVAFADILYYVETSVKAGWAAGAYGQPKFGYDDGKSVTLIFNGNSFTKSKEVYVDGFEMSLKTFYDKSGVYNSPAVIIASTSNWFSLDSLGTMAFSIEKTENAGQALFRVRGSLGSTRYLYIQDFYVNNWNWNNNKENTIKLNLVEDTWVWTLNGTAYPTEGENQYSAKYNEAYEDFAENAGYLQFDSGNGYVWKITNVCEVSYNVPPKVENVELKSSYNVGEKVSIDLSNAFSDANGDTLEYILVTGNAVINDGKLEFSADEVGTYEVKVQANDGKGGSAVLSLTFVVQKLEKDSSSCSCSSSIESMILSAFAVIVASLLLILNKRRQYKVN